MLPRFPPPLWKVNAVTMGKGLCEEYAAGSRSLSDFLGSVGQVCEQTSRCDDVGLSCRTIAIPLFTDIVSFYLCFGLFCAENWQCSQHTHAFLSPHGDRHAGVISFTVWLFVIPTCRHVCYPHMPTGMVGIYRLLFVCLFFCVSAGFLVTDNSGTGWRSAMKFCRVVDLGVQQVISPSGELWPRGKHPKVKYWKIVNTFDGR